MSPAEGKVKQAQRDNPNERRSHNRRLAETLVKAGLSIFASVDKMPVVKEWTRLDAAIGTDEMETLRVKYRVDAINQGKIYDERTFIGCTRDLDTVKRMWRQHPDAVPSISLGPSELYVLDCDIDADRHGPTLVKAWLAENGIDTSMCPMTTSRSGALHIYFKGAGLLSHVGSLMKSMYCQVKATGNQVVAPGAWREDGKRYQPIDGQPGLMVAYAGDELPAVPGVLLKFQTEHQGDNIDDADIAPIAARMRGDLPDIDFDPNSLTKATSDASNSRFSLALEMGRTFGKAFTPELYTSAALQFEGAGIFVGDGRPGQGEYDYRALAREFTKARERVGKSEAARAAAFALDTPETALAAVAKAVAAGEQTDDECARLLMALENEDMPAARMEAVRVKVSDLSNSYVLGTGQAHALKSLAAEVIGEAPAALPAKAAKPSLVTLDIDAAAAWTPIEWLVDGLIPRGSLGIAFGPPDSLKSFMMIDLASHIARGRDCLGRRVERAGVVYWFGEGRQGIAGRFKAWGLTHDTSGGAVGLADAPLKFANAESAEKTLRRLARDYETASGHRCELIIIDTLSKAMLGINENDNGEVATALRHVELAAKALDVTILFVAHTGKDGSARGVRGASAFEGNVDFRLEFRGGLLTVERMKDARKIAPIRFEPREVEIGRNKYGEPVTSLTIGKWGPAAATSGAAFGDTTCQDFAEERAKLTADQRTILDVAYAAIDAAGGEAVAPGTIVAAVQVGAPNMKDDTIRKTLRGRLLKDGLVERVGENYRRPVPRKFEAPDD